MSNALRVRLSYFLLFCFLTAVFPFGAFHHHDAVLHCDKDNVAEEHNPCHVSVYHRNLQEEHCNHDSHYTQENEECAFCHFQSTNIHKFKTDAGNDLINVVYRATQPVLEIYLIVSGTNRSTSSRAPPVC